MPLRGLVILLWQVTRDPGFQPVRSKGFEPFDLMGFKPIDLNLPKQKKGRVSRPAGCGPMAHGPKRPAC